MMSHHWWLAGDIDLRRTFCILIVIFLQKGIEHNLILFYYTCTVQNVWAAHQFTKTSLRQERRIRIRAILWSVSDTTPRPPPGRKRGVLKVLTQKLSTWYFMRVPSASCNASIFGICCNLQPTIPSPNLNYFASRAQQKISRVLQRVKYKWGHSYTAQSVWRGRAVSSEGSVKLYKWPLRAKTTTTVN